MVLQDTDLHPFERLFAGLADVDADFADPTIGAALRLTAAKIDVPIELGVGVTDAGTVALATSPPTQHVRTTYMPVFHRVRIEIAADEDVDADS